MGGGSPDTMTNIIRYAPYVEATHTGLIQAMQNLLNQNYLSSPYDDYDQLPLDDDFFDGNSLSAFPSLWDMYGKFMAGLDVHQLWTEIYDDVIRGAEIAAAVSAHSAEIQNDINTNVLPKFHAGMRDINAVQSSAFVIGRALIQDGHVRAVNKFASNIRIQAIPLSVEMWKSHLNWNQGVTHVYAQMYQLYYDIKTESDRLDLEYAARHEMWELELLPYGVQVLGALQGAGGRTTGNVPGPSKTQKAAGGALSGSMTGAMIGSRSGNAYGIAIGAIAGAIIGGIGGYYS